MSSMGSGGLGILRGKRAPSGQQLIKYRAEGEDVAAHIGGFSAHLLGGQVRFGAAGFG
jgi:hypothetical protein